MCGSQPGMQWWQKLSQQQGNIHISRNHIEGWGQDSLEYNGYALYEQTCKKWSGSRIVLKPSTFVANIYNHYN